MWSGVGVGVHVDEVGFRLGERLVIRQFATHLSCIMLFELDDMGLVVTAMSMDRFEEKPLDPGA